MIDEVRIDGFICRVSYDYDINLTNVNFQDCVGTAICMLELQGEKKTDEIKVGFDFDFKIWYDEAPDEDGKFHTYIDGFEVEKLYRRFMSLHTISYGAEEFNISKKEYCDIIEEAILKLDEDFGYRIGCALDDKYEGYPID